MTPPDAWQLTPDGAESYERHQVPSLFAPLARILLEQIDLRPGQRVLDVACGTGIVARLAADAVGPAGRVVGVDLNAAMLRVARESAAARDGNLTWRRGDASALPCTAASFDVVLCQQGLQFFPDRAGALAEMARVLTPGGRLAVSVWQSIEHSPCNAASLVALRRHLAADQANRLRAPFTLGEPEALEAAIAAAGFEDVEVRAAMVNRRMKPASLSIPGHLASTPVGPAVAALGAPARALLVREIADALEAYRVPDGLAVPQGSLIALARKPKARRTSPKALSLRRPRC